MLLGRWAAPFDPNLVGFYGPSSWAMLLEAQEQETEGRAFSLYKSNLLQRSVPKY